VRPFIVFAVLGLSSCGGAQQGREAQAAASDDVGRAAIHLQHGIPTMHVLVGHLPFQVAIDTGTNAHVLVGSALSLAGGRSGPLHEAQTPSGSVLVASALGAPMHVGSHVASPVLTVSELPVTGARMAGLLAPLLWADEGVRIDLLHGELTVGDPEVLGGSPEPEAAPSFTARVGRCDGPSPTLAAIVLGEIGGVPVRLLLDTGATYTTLSADSEAGARLLASSEATPETVLGPLAAIEGHRVSAVRVEVGAHARELEIHVDPAGADGCAIDGLLGADMLLGCVLDIRGSRLSARCEGAADLPVLRASETRIHVARVEIEAACGVDEQQLHAASHPDGGWTFVDWMEAAEALSSTAESTADPPPIHRAASLVTAACARAHRPRRAYTFRWSRASHALVLHYELEASAR
jgi:hypothetical protein